MTETDHLSKWGCSLSLLAAANWHGVLIQQCWRKHTAIDIFFLLAFWKFDYNFWNVLMETYGTYFISLGFQFNHVDGPGFYGGSCGGFAGGTQMAGSSPQPVKAQEQQQQQEMPTNLIAQQHLLQIGKQHISSYNLCCQRWMNSVFKCSCCICTNMHPAILCLF